jgi:hypothetical protein
LNLPRQAVIGIILVVALLAFEIFNFDTTRFALRDLLGPISFFGLEWAAILAIAFCAIDFAGLARLFTPQQGQNEPREVWYLMGAWLLGATMNAIMTWWAVSLTLLDHSLGNEVLSREELLQAVPIFVAILVWLTRILFIGAFSVAGDHFFNSADIAQPRPAARQAIVARPASERNSADQGRPRSRRVPHTSDDVPAFLARQRGGATVENGQPEWSEPEVSRPLPILEPLELGETVPVAPAKPRNDRVRQRPPSPGPVRPVPLGAAPRGRRSG